MDVLTIKQYSRRMLMATAAAGILVAACSLSMQPYTLKDPIQVGGILLATLVFAIPCAAVSALLFRRNDLALILGSQVLTVIALASLVMLRA